MYSSHQPATEMLVGTVDGVVVLRRKNIDGEWVVDGRGLSARHVVALMVLPDGKIVGSMHNGGVAFSEDSGRTWEFRNQGLASENAYCLNYSVSGNRIRIYAGTEPAHLYFSDDCGAHWSEITALRSVPSVSKWTFPVPPNQGHVKDIAVHPRDPNTLYVCVEQGGVFRTNDGGKTWNELHHTLHNDDCHRLVMVPSKPHTMFLPTGYGFYWSTDGGDTWENIGKRVPRLIYPDPLVINPLNEDLVFMSGASASPHSWLQTHSADPRIARSRDGGVTWEVVDHGMPEHMDANFEAMTLEAWNGSCAIYAGNTDGDIYCTLDEGNSWFKAAQGLPPISKTIHYAILRPRESSKEAQETVSGISPISRYQYE